MKLIGTNDSEISKYPFDYFSILHLICGIFGYICVFPIIHLFISESTALFLTHLIVILGGIFWEIVENSILIDMKMGKERDFIVNSQLDVIIVFLGAILGCYLYKLPMLLTVFVIGGLFVFFTVAKILTKVKFWKKKMAKKT